MSMNSTSYNTAPETQPQKISEDGTHKSVKSLSNKSIHTTNSLKHQQSNIDQVLEEENKEQNGKKSILRSIRNLFFKASLNLSLAKAKLRQFAEEALSSDEVVNELFLVTSSSSVDSSLLEQEDTETTNRDAQSANATSENQTHSELPNFSEFDAVKEADSLRDPKVPFDQGDKVWTKRREIWLNYTEEDKLRSKQRQCENHVTNLSIISKDNYPILYSSLIEKSKTLKKPLNLKDAIKIINAGWVANRKWEKASQGLL